MPLIWSTPYRHSTPSMTLHSGDGSTVALSILAGWCYDVGSRPERFIGLELNTDGSGVNAHPLAIDLKQGLWFALRQGLFDLPQVVYGLSNQSVEPKLDDGLVVLYFCDMGQAVVHTKTGGVK